MTTYLTDVSNFDTGVYQLATTDPVQGGAGGVSNMPLQNLANRTRWLYDQLNAVLNGTTIPTGLAPLLSPTFTGTPAAPTPALGDNTTKLATTAFVQGTVNGRLSLSVAGGSNVTLTAVQAGYGILTLTGALTAAISVIVPSTSGQWIVENNTTGAYALTVKTAAGTGIAVTQGAQTSLFCDGTNVQATVTDFPSIAITGTPTAPTPALFDSSTRLATTAFVHSALGNLASYESHNASIALPVASAGNCVMLYGTTASQVATLPLLSSLPTGATFWIFNGGTVPWTVSVNSTSTESFTSLSPTGVTSPTSITLGVGDSIAFIASASNSIWRAFGTTSANLLASPAMTGAPTAPTAAQFDSSTKLATTAFVKQAGFSYPTAGVGIAASVTLTAAQLNGWGQFQAAGLTVTLPALASTVLGCTFTFLGGATGGTIKANASESIQSAVASTSNTVSVGVGEIVTVAANGGSSSWFVVSDGISANSPILTGSPTAPTAALFDSSTKLATTAFVQAALGNFGGVTLCNSGSVTLPSTAYGDAIQVGTTVGATITLPAAGNAGACITFYHQGANTTTIAAPSGGFIYAPGAGFGNTNTSLSLKPADTVVLMNRGGSEWDVVGGSWVTTNESVGFSGTQTTVTQAAGDSSTKLATTAFVQNALGNYQSRQYVTAATTLTQSESGAWVQCGGTGPYTITLPAPTTINTVLTISHVATGTVTLSTPSASIYNQGVATSTLALVNSDTIKLGSDGSNWNVLAFYTKSPTFVGVPAGPTAAVSTNTTQLATTAFVLGQAATAAPLINGTAAVGTSLLYARQDHVHPTDTTRAAVASPTFTGVPAAPTASVSTNTTQIATTAFVLGQAATVAPLINGTAAVGTSLLYARQDHVHPIDTTRAALASPTFTGTPAAPTAALFDSTTKLATTAFVKNAGVSFSNQSVITASTTLTAAAHAGRFITVGSAGVNAALTLPAASTCAVGTVLHINSQATGVTVVASGSDQISQIPGSSTTAAMNVNDTLSLVSDGSSVWIAISGSVHLGASAVFGASRATSGYQKLPGGVIIQWGSGSYSGASGSQTTVNFPIAFPNNVFIVTGSIGSALADCTIGAQASSPSQFAIGYHSTSGSTATGTYYAWTAVGY